MSLHQVLGGGDDELEPVIEVIRSAEARAKFVKHKDNRREFEQAHSSLLKTVDRSPSFHRYADWLDGSIAGRSVVPGDRKDFGVWGRRVVFLATRAARRRELDQTLPAPLVQWAIEGDAGIDSGVPVKATWAARVGASSGEAGNVEAALLIADEPPTGDAVSDGLRRALVAQGLSYTGLAHAEAVVALEQSESVRAWKALHSATWWAARQMSDITSTLFDGARLLVSQNDWPDVQWVVERGVAA
jgi:hypothetical protein